MTALFLLGFSSGRNCKWCLCKVVSTTCLLKALLSKLTHPTPKAFLEIGFCYHGCLGFLVVDQKWLREVFLLSELGIVLELSVMLHSQHLVMASMSVFGNWSFLVVYSRKLISLKKGKALCTIGRKLGVLKNAIFGQWRLNHLFLILF